jgi:hypothetical protein
MKKLMAVAALAFFALTGCAGWNISDDANTQAIAYASGKTTGALINKFAPKADQPLGEAWVSMMTANAGADPIPAASIVAFYQQAILLLAAQSQDPYGLISDLTMLLSIYGGQLTADGQMVLAQPIPLKVAKAFELGYKSGKSAVQAFQVQRAAP